jgi:DNA (cytosine-5)-methyltransferase 1
VADAGQVGRDGWASPAGCETGANAGAEGRSGSDVADALFVGRQGPGALGRPGNSTAGDDGQASDVVNVGAGFWRGHRWAVGADGKARRVESSIRLLAHGVPARVGKLRAYGNAIVPQVAAEIIGAYLDVAP